MNAGRQTIVCPICSSERSRVKMELRDHFSHESFDLHYCLDCGGLYIKNPPASDRIGDYYNNESGKLMHKTPGSFFSNLQRIQFRRDLRSLMKRLNTGSRIVDFGAGDGALCRFLSERGFIVQGVDFYPESEWTQPSIPYRSSNLNGDRINAGDILCHDALPAAVIMRHVLEHLFDPYNVLRLLHDQGVRYVLIVVPNADSALARWFGPDWYHWDPPRHLTFFNPKTLSRLADRAGYRVVEQKTYGIDEIVSSYFRARLLTRDTKQPNQNQDHIVKYFNPKSPLAAVSSSLAAFTTNTVCRCLLEKS